MKKLILILIFAGCIIPGRTICQTTEELQENYDEGQYFLSRGDYEDALYFFQRLIKTDSLNSNFNFKIGECYLNMPGKEQLAIPYFERALMKVVPKKTYKKRSVDERAAPLHVYFYLGNAYRMNNELDKALSSYQKFIESPYFYGNYNENIVENEIQTCKRAKKMQEAAIEFDTLNLGNAINSEFAEEHPVISGDGKTLVFIRKLKFYDAICYSVKKDDVWQKAVNINPQLISDGEYIPTGLSRDGKTLLLSRKDNESFDIYISSFDGFVWSAAVKMNDKINSKAEEVHASFCPDDQSMLISSNRSATKGGYDIYISKKAKDGTWMRPTKLSKNINTDFDEQSAFMTSSPETIYFSSQGHYTMGGYDIFYSKKVGKKWTTAMNIGYPINNNRDNLYYCPSANQAREGYISLQSETGFGGTDIFLLKIKTENTLNFNSLSDNE